MSILEDLVIAWKILTSKEQSTEIFTSINASIKQKNATAERLLREIMEHPEVTIKNLNQGGAEFRTPDGKGVRFNSNGTLYGLLNRIDLPELKSGFGIIRFSPLDHEKTTAEIEYNLPNGTTEQIAWITMDEGFSKAQIELFTEFLDPNFVPEFYLADFLEAIEAAKAVLKDYDDENHEPT